MNETYNWVLAVHAFGFVLWTGALMSTLFLLSSHHLAADSGRKGLERVERKAAMGMDIGALIAIVAGLYLALGFDVNWFKQGSWLHIKTTLVAVLVGLHVFTRVKVRKFRNGAVSPISGYVIPLTLLLVAVIVVFGEVKTLLR